jgi:hypothetical protein
MKIISVEKLPKEVLEKAKIVGNIFDMAEKREEFLNEWFQGLTCALMSTGIIETKEWNEKIAPLLREYGKKLGLKWLNH